ncbi:MAG: BamA/TamA family outer membrane protein [Synergistetes bacterium]|nr:BamA/TamA family outer membrane protein [Synergistota bacterium]MDW8193123.1 POTRA domain-containing protein [Synergistota bacterium]
MRSLLLCLFLIFLSAGVVFAAPIIKAIDVEGNITVQKDRILAVVQSKVGEPVDEEKIKEDVKRIYDMGFFKSVSVKGQPYEDGVKVIFVVEEFEPIKEIIIEGNTVIPTKKIREVMFLTEGMRFNASFFKRDIDRIVDLYRREGYGLIRIMDAGFSKGVVFLKILEPRVKEIVIQGNKRTKDYVVRRYIYIKPGEVLNTKKLQLSLSRLEATEFFEKVEAYPEPTEEIGWINIVFRVEEKSTTRLMLGIGYGSVTGWEGEAAYENFNFMGRGIRVSIGLGLGEEERQWVSWEDPWMDEKHFAYKFGFFRRDYTDVNWYDRETGEVKGTYDESAEGFYIGFGRKINNKVSFYLTLTHENVNITPTSGEPPDREEVLQGEVRYLTLSLTRDNRNPYVPYSVGDVESLIVEHAGLFGGDYNYSKYIGEVKFYLPFELNKWLGIELGAEEERPWIIAARARYGDSSGTLPYFEKFFVGGATTLRGYPRSYFFGEKMVLANVELRIPIEKGLELVVFNDWGYAWSKDESISLSDLKRGVGFGLRVRTPFGIIRADFAENEEGETQSYIGFGHIF